MRRFIPLFIFFGITAILYSADKYSKLKLQVKEQPKAVVINALKITPGNIIDGDTIKADVFLPLEVSLYDQSVRCGKVDAFELSEPKGKEAKAAVEKLVKSSTETYIILQGSGYDKYRRVIGEVIFSTPEGSVADRKSVV